MYFWDTNIIIALVKKLAPRQNVKILPLWSENWLYKGVVFGGNLNALAHTQPALFLIQLCNFFWFENK